MPIPPGSREAILDSATTLFARQGLVGTSIKQIAAAASVNSALIYYYFADKDALYAAVLEGLFREFSERLPPAVAGAGPADALRAIIRTQAEIFIATPLLPRLIARELADHEARQAASIIATHASRIFQLLAGIIRGGQAAGVFRADLDPALTAISCIAQVNWYCIAAPAIALLGAFESGAAAPEQIRRFAEHAAEFVLGALAPAPAPAPAPAGPLPGRS